MAGSLSLIVVQCLGGPERFFVFSVGNQELMTTRMKLSMITGI